VSISDAVIQTYLYLSEGAAESIKKQYAEKRSLLFASPDVLPEFRLETLKAVQSIAGSKVAFDTWFDAYDDMCGEIEKIDFDVCLVGAGAYGLPLASFAKRLGKKAIHMGGITQILFGIKRRDGKPSSAIRPANYSMNTGYGRWSPKRQKTKTTWRTVATGKPVR